MLFVVHVALAFHFYHHWSHTIAWQSTAERTNELLGVAVGDGIYCSYLFLALWVLDVVCMWLHPIPDEVANGTPSVAAHADASSVPFRPNSLTRTPWWRVLVHVFLLFVAINGAIVFEAGPTRWAGIAACLALCLLAAGRARSFVDSPHTKCPVESTSSVVSPSEEAVVT